MKTCEFPKDWKGVGQVFPRKICEDPWAFYHGTSGINESAIDKEGLRWSGNLVSKDEIQKVVSVFEEMPWAGTDFGGLGVLNGYSLQSDFREGSHKPIFLGETSQRALLYASADFAGGESARGIRKAVTDLEAYLSSSEVRKKHLDYRQREYDHLVEVGAQSGDSPVAVDLEWLREKLSSLQELKQRVWALCADHAYGVVYAVRFVEEDVENLQMSNMGLRVNFALQPARIVGKVRVPRDIIPPIRCRDDDRINHLLYPSGLIAAIQKHNAHAQEK